MSDWTVDHPPPCGRCDQCKAQALLVERLDLVNSSLLREYRLVYSDRDPRDAEATERRWGEVRRQVVEQFLPLYNRLTGCQDRIVIRPPTPEGGGKVEP